MSLPYIIQAILSLKSNDGSPMAYKRQYQVVQIVPPVGAAGNPYQHTTAPTTTNDYANIVYRFTFGTTIVPGTLTVNVQMSGIQSPFNTTITGAILSRPEDCLLFCLKGDKILFEITNTTVLNQNYEVNIDYVQIQNPDTYSAVLDIIKVMTKP